MRKMAKNLINDVNVKLTEWQCSGDIDYLYHAIALIRAHIEYEQMDEILGVDGTNVAPSNGIRVVDAIWDRQSGVVYCGNCHESVLRYHTFCPHCGCYLIRDKN